MADGASVYVAWYRKSSDAPWTRLASLEYDEDDRTATLNATAPETSFDLAVSAEEKGDVASPSAAVVFSQRIN